MSQRKQRRDEVCAKDSTKTSKCTTGVTGINGVCGDPLDSGRWQRRSLFSSERLDLILSNLRRNLDKSVDGNQCRPISHDLTHGCAVQRRNHQQQQQQQQRGAGKHYRISGNYCTKNWHSHCTVLITLREGRVESLCRQLSLHGSTCDARNLMCAFRVYYVSLNVL